MTDSRLACQPDSWEPDYAYERLRPPTRQGKPRDKGLTAIIDMETDIMGWMGLAGTRDFLGVASGFVDFVKIQTFHALSLPHGYIKQKVALYRDFGIAPFVGGILFELAYVDNALDELILHLKRLEVPALEISENYITLARDERLRFFERFSGEGFHVIYEYGRRQADTPLTIAHLGSVVADCLTNGIDHIIIEEDEINIMAAQAPQTLEELRAQPWMSKIFIEADPFSFPRQHATLVKQFGPDVNLCNIAAGQAIRLEDFRLGMGRQMNFKYLADRVPK